MPLGLSCCRDYDAAFIGALTDVNFVHFRANKVRLVEQQPASIFQAEN
jgi:hypothetical protein